ncbi:cell division protein FtsQ/DivIB [Sinosporangium siamense]|uniref:Cell division protein FtsQ n=1 Tax=Sinosporangium siamense TaxID=1367973 RepID=A0A919REI1_9ACTN|nr:FtsQ-type POTRA domain-containing protein [Sinosporangium siamense]GII90324.1 cell division protein FtsQ [Sinosporangium siamense]
MRARTAFIALLTAGVVGSAAWLVFFSPVLGVREVQIVGNVTIPTELIRKAVGVADREPLATVDLADVERRVLSIKQLESARIDRNWPGTLKVRVVERRPVAALPYGGAFALVDRHGVVMQVVPAAPPRMPVLKVSQPKPGDPATAAALAVIRALPETLGRTVREVRAPSAESVSLMLNDGREVVFGGADRAAEKVRVITGLLRKPYDVYDVSTPDVVTVK